MTQPGWYPDFEDPSQLRYHDGAAWTDHKHRDDPVQVQAQVETPAQSPAVVTALNDVVGETADNPKQDPRWVRLITFPVLGAFAGLLLGGFVFNALGSITPVTELAGTVDRIEIEVSRRSGSAANDVSYVLSGTTVDGADWRIVNEDAYDVLQQEGYPQQVTVAIGDWTGTPERVTGESFEVDHQGTGARVGWVAAIAVSVLIGVGIAIVISRAKSAGRSEAAVFLFSMLVPGSWLGYVAFRWIQTS